MPKAHIIEWPNILQPRSGEVIYEIEAGITLDQWMSDNVPRYDRTLSQHPVTCLFNDREILPDQWPAFVIHEGYTVVLAVRPFGFDPFTIAIAAVAAFAAASMAISTMPTPPSELAIPDASPTYDINARGNRARLNSPIPFAFGRNRHWLDMLTKPAKNNEGNDVYLMQLFCVGDGEFDIEKVNIGDTEAKDYKDIEYEDYPPNQKIELFSDNIDTSEDIGGIELFGSNEDEYDGWTADFIIVAKNQTANYLGCDFSARSGIYGLNDEGGLYARSAEIEVRYRAIDEDDNPLGEYQTKTFTYRAATTTPQRYSERWKVSEGRYQISARRANNAGTSTRTKDSMHWEAGKAYYPSKQRYEGVTTLAVRVRASNNISQQSETRFNVIATAKTPIWLEGKWTAPVANSEIAWAFCHAIRSDHGGNLPADIIDMPNILSVHEQWKAAGETINCIFDTEGTLMGMLQEIAACGRGSVITHDGKFYVVRDAAKTIRQAMYTPFMMTSAPRIERTFEEAYEKDSVIVEYFNQKLWEMDEVLCQLPNHTANNPKRITLRGVSTHDQAWRIGIFEAAKMKYRRKRINFTTELEGKNSIFGDKVAVSYWLKGWGQSGEVISKEGNRLLLSHPVTFEGEGYKVGLSRPDGSFSGTYPIEFISSTEIIVTGDIDFDVQTGNRRQRTQYQIGKGENVCQDFIIEDITSSGDSRVTIKAFYDNPIVYDFENAIPPPDPTDEPVPDPVAPIISNLQIVQDVLDPQTVTLTWQSSITAREYIIEHSLNNEDWARIAVSTVPVFQTKLYNGKNWFRVAGVLDTQGDYAFADIELKGDGFETPVLTEVSLQEPFTGKTLKIQWKPVLSATSYTIEIIKAGQTLYKVENYQSVAFEYSGEQGINHGAGRTFTVKVTPVNGRGNAGTGAELDVSNPAPAAPVNVRVVGLVDSVTITCDLNVEPDLRELRLYGSQTKGFTPSPSTLLKISDTTRIDLNVKKGIWYYRLAWVDVWGTDRLNYSTEDDETSKEIDIDIDFDKEIKESFDENFSDYFKDEFGSSIDDVFPITGTQIKDGAIAADNMAANSILAKNILSDQILGRHIISETIEGKHIIANTIKANHLDVNNLSAISANIGTMTAGTFRTNSATGSRVEMSSDGQIPFFIGTGAKTMANAKLAYDEKTGELVFRGTLNIKSSASGERFELTNEAIKVYDSGNTLRAEFGKLS